jgi:ABC-type sugar transport system permease subunit
MGAVDPSLIDAARIDGAGWWRVQRHVVFWQILPIIELATVLSLIGVFTGLFPLILLVTKGGPDFATTTADMYSYQQATSYYHYGYASAVAVALLVIAAVVMGVAFTLFRRGRSES